jgi:hypothetical protein
VALIKCKECGANISDMSEKCIHCGAPTSYSMNEYTLGATRTSQVPRVTDKLPLSLQNKTKSKVYFLAVPIVVLLLAIVVWIAISHLPNLNVPSVMKPSDDVTVSVTEQATQYPNALPASPSIAPSEDVIQNSSESNYIIDYILHIVEGDDGSELWIKYFDGRNELLTKDIPVWPTLIDQDVSLDGKTAYCVVAGGSYQVPYLYSIDIATKVIKEVYCTDEIQVIRTGKYTGNLLVEGILQDESSSSYLIIDYNSNIIVELTDQEYQLISEEKPVDADILEDDGYIYDGPSEEEIIAMEADEPQ